MSLDGYIAGPHGEYDWIAMDPEMDFAGFLAPLHGLVDHVCGVTIPGADHGVPGERVAAIARGAGFAASAAPSVPEAVRQLADDPPARVLICGSLYLAGGVLADNG